MGKYDSYRAKYLNKSSSDNKTLSSIDAKVKQANNLKARLEASGVNPEEATDKRNWFEKLTNLPQDQNMVFDFFDLLNRPQQALFGGWKNAQEGKDFFEGAKEGLYGNQKTDFKDILMNTGAFEDEKGKLDLVDALGFAGDIFLDPADLIPVAGFSKIGKALDKGDNVYKAIRSADSLTDVAFKGLGKAAKGGAKLADTGIEKGLKYLDESKCVLNAAGDTVKLKYLTPNAKDAANLNAKVVDAAQDATGAIGRLELYKNAKNKFSNAFKLSDKAKDAIGAQRAIGTQAEMAQEAAKMKIKEAQDTAEAYFKQTNGKYGDAKTLLNDSQLLINSTVNRAKTEDEIMSLIKKGEAPAYPEYIEHLETMLKRDVPDETIKALQQKYGKKAFDISVEGTHIKLGKGWDKVEFSNVKPIDAEIKKTTKRLKQLDKLANDEEALRKLNPYEVAELEIENNELTNSLRDLYNQKDAYTIQVERRFTPEQEKKINELARRYAYNEDGYRDFVDSIHGTAWKRQKSDILSEVEDYSKYGENIFSNAENPTPTYLSKNQALVMDPYEVFSGRTTNRDVINATNRDTGKLSTNANTVFYTDNPAMAADYSGGNTLATAENLGDKNVTYRGLFSKTPEENVLEIGPNGAYYNDKKMQELAYMPGDETYSWMNVPYKDFDSYNTFSKIGEKETAKLLDIVNSNDVKNGNDLIRELNKSKNKSLLNKLKSYGIDINTVDRPSVADAVRDAGSNIDADNLYELINEVNTYGAESIKDAADFLFQSGNRTTDELAENIYKNQATGRATKNYNTISLSGIEDSVAGTQMGDDFITINPGTNDVQPRRFKALANKTPALETNSVFDTKELKKPIVKSTTDKLNDVVDNFVGTKLGSKYNYLTNDNYVAAHILTPEGKQVIDALKQSKNKALSNINSSILNSRKYVGAPEEINNFFRELVDKMDSKTVDSIPALKAFKENKDLNFMETDYIKALTNNYASEKGLTNVAGKIQTVNQNILNGTFKDLDNISKTQRKIEDAFKATGKVDDALSSQYKKLVDNSPIKPLTEFDNKVPDNFTKVTNGELQDMIKQYIRTNSGFGMDKNTKELSNLLKKVAANGGDVAINTDVLRTIGAVSDPKNINALNTLYNKYLNVFKKWKTASPTNFLNNLFGNSTNMMLGGVSMADQAKYAPQVIDIMQNGEKYYLRKLAGEKLDDAAAKTAQYWEDFRKLGFGSASLDLAELPQDVRDIIQKKKSLKGTKDYILNGLPSMFGYLNQKGDMAARLTVMLKSYDDPKFLKQLGAKDAYEAISKIMFDPEMLTSTEKKIKQFIPFYTYNKNNLVYHITNMPNNGVKYNRLMKTMKNLRNQATNGNEDNMADYIKNSLYIPLPGLDKDGNYTVLRAQLPFGQLIETVDDPLRQFASMSSPLAKGAYEWATGIDAFTGRPIEDFPGQKSNNIDLFGFNPSKKTEKLLSDFSGIDVALKNASRLLGGDPMSTVRMTRNIDSDRLSKMYTEVEDLQNLMKQYEQKGYEFSTINELKKANTNSNVANINAILAKYGIETK